MKISQKDFQKMLEERDVDLLVHLVLSTANDEIVKSYDEKKELDIVLTVNGHEVDVKSFLKMFEEQYDEQCLIEAKKEVLPKMEKALEPFFEMSDMFQDAYETVIREARMAVAHAVDADWLFDKREY